jgi:hypothetical protein
MKRIRKQSTRIEELIKKLGAALRNSTTDPDSTATGEGDCDSDRESKMNEDNHTASSIDAR